MSQIDECLKIAQDAMGINPIVALAEDEVAEMRYLLAFAVVNEHNFAEHDPDGVKAEWIRRARNVLPKSLLGEKE